MAVNGLVDAGHSYPAYRTGHAAGLCDMDWLEMKIKGFWFFLSVLSVAVAMVLANFMLGG